MRRYNRTTAPRSHEIEQCVGCGYPFDPGEPCLETTAEELVCGAACADYMERVYRQRNASIDPDAAVLALRDEEVTP